MKYDEVARIAWETNRALQVMEGDEYPDPPWESAPEWRRRLCETCVMMAAEGGYGPKTTHDTWRAEMESRGWRYGKEKNPERKVHPGLRSWRELNGKEQLAQRLLVIIAEECKLAAATERPAVEYRSD